MMPYGYITMLYVLFRVVTSAWRKILEKTVKFTKFHERLFYSRFRVVMSAWAMPFRVVYNASACRRTFVLVSRFENFLAEMPSTTFRVARSPGACPDLFRVAIGEAAQPPFRVAMSGSASGRPARPDYTKETQP